MSSRRSSPPSEMRLEREATMVDFKLRSPSRSPCRPLTCSPTSEPASSPSAFSPRLNLADRSPSPSRNPADADEILDFVRHQQKSTNGLTMEREPTMTWDEKRKPLLPGIPRSPREGDENDMGRHSTSDGNLLKPSHSSLSRSLENIPEPNPKLVDPNRLLKPKMPVARVRSLPPIEVHMDRPSAPDPMYGDHSPRGDQWNDQWSDSSPEGSCQNSPRR